MSKVTTILTMTIPMRTYSPNGSHMHWAKKAKRAKEQRSVVALMLRSKCPHTGRFGWGPPYVITLTRISPRKLDDDNLRGALKACRDGVADWLGIDDGSELLTWHYLQTTGAYAVGVVVEPR